MICSHEGVEHQNDRFPCKGWLIGESVGTYYLYYLTWLLLVLHHVTTTIVIHHVTATSDTSIMSLLLTAALMIVSHNIRSSGRQRVLVHQLVFPTRPFVARQVKGRNIGTKYHENIVTMPCLDHGSPCFVTMQPASLIFCSSLWRESGHATGIMMKTSDILNWEEVFTVQMDSHLRYSESCLKIHEETSFIKVNCDIKKQGGSVDRYFLLVREASPVLSVWACVLVYDTLTQVYVSVYNIAEHKSACLRLTWMESATTPRSPACEIFGEFGGQRGNWSVNAE